MTSGQLDLRALIADTVRDVVAEMVAGSVSEALAGQSESPARPPQSPPAGPGGPEAAPVAGSQYVTRDPGRSRVERVRIDDDRDLADFVRHLMALFENPKNRQDLRAGRLSFALHQMRQATPERGPALRLLSGALTERQVSEAYDQGRRIILGRAAVITPLGREKARALGVSIERERS